MGASVVIKLGLQLAALLVRLPILLFQLSVPVLEGVSLADEVLNVDLQVL